MAYRPEFDFRFNRAEGEAIENRLQKILSGKTVEVKSDKLCEQTANVFVEYSQNGGRASGIAVTKADYWAIEFNGCFLVIPTEKLKAAARWHYKERPKLRKSGGDNDNHGVAIPLVALVDYLRRMG